jgi:hypothetical protein
MAFERMQLAWFRKLLVLDFMGKDKGKAYTVLELQDAVKNTADNASRDITAMTRRTLYRLKSKGLIRREPDLAVPAPIPGAPHLQKRFSLWSVTEKGLVHLGNRRATYKAYRKKLEEALQNE